ncbi:hypothetical protein [Kribbella sancticallisti]
MASSRTSAQIKDYRSKYGDSPAQAWIVLGQSSTGQGTVLHLHRLYEHSGPIAWITPARLTVPVGDLVFIHHGVMSFFDPRRFEVGVVSVTFLRKLPRKPFFKLLRAWLLGEPPV